jgi:hypothetical protein
MAYPGKRLPERPTYPVGLPGHEKPRGLPGAAYRLPRTAYPARTASAISRNLPAESVKRAASRSALKARSRK